MGRRCGSLAAGLTGRALWGESPGWARSERQWRYLTREVRSLFNRVRSIAASLKSAIRSAVEMWYLARLPRAGRAGGPDTLSIALRNQGVDAVTCGSIEGYVAHALRQIGQVERRLVRGETDTSCRREGLLRFSSEHTRWVSKLLLQGGCARWNSAVSLSPGATSKESVWQSPIHSPRDPVGELVGGFRRTWRCRMVHLNSPAADTSVWYPVVPGTRACLRPALSGARTTGSQLATSLLDLNALPKKDGLSGTSTREAARIQKALEILPPRAACTRRLSRPLTDWSTAGLNTCPPSWKSDGFEACGCLVACWRANLHRHRG